MKVTAEEWVTILKLEVTLQLPEFVRKRADEIEALLHRHFHIPDMDLTDYWPWVRISINTAEDDYLSMAKKVADVLKEVV